MDEKPADAVWAMLALGAPDGSQPAINANRIGDFADRDQSEDRQRTALLVACLAGLGRIDAALAGRLNRTYQLGLGAETGWTRMIDGAMRRRQAGTSICLPLERCRAASSTTSGRFTCFMRPTRCGARARNIWRG
jgi:hypothetical protein